jgi:hypothetical protein
LADAAVVIDAAPPPPPPKLLGEKEAAWLTGCLSMMGNRDPKMAECYAPGATSSFVEWAPAKEPEAIAKAHLAFGGSFDGFALEPQLVLLAEHDAFAILLVRGTQKAPLELGDLTIASKKKPAGLLAAVHFTLAGEPARITNERWSFDVPTLTAQLAGTAKGRKAITQSFPVGQTIMSTKDQAEGANIFAMNNALLAWNERAADYADKFTPTARLADDTLSADITGHDAIAKHAADSFKAAGDVKIEPKTVWTSGPFTVAEVHRSGTNAAKQSIDQTVLEITRWQGGKIDGLWRFTPSARPAK